MNLGGQLCPAQQICPRNTSSVQSDLIGSDCSYTLKQAALEHQYICTFTFTSFCVHKIKDFMFLMIPCSSAALMFSLLIVLSVQ